MDKRSFFERLTGATPLDQNKPLLDLSEHQSPALVPDEEGQLTVDMWQAPSEIVIQTMVGGVKPDDLDVNISHEMVTIRGKRAKSHQISSPDYFYQELFWGTFSRSIVLPQEIDVDGSEATIKNGLLTVRLPKLDKSRSQKLKVKNE